VLPELLTQEPSRSLRAAVRRIRENRPAGAAVAGLEGGIHVVVESLEERLRALGARIELGEPREAGESGDDLVVDARPGPVASRTTVVSLVVDAPELDAAPRGTGVLVTRSEGDAPRAVTHSSAKWPWLAARLAPQRHALRVSYDGHLDDDAALRARALDDVARLLAVPLGGRELVASHVAHWTQSERIAVADPPGAIRVGSAVAGSGLARVIAHARAAVAERVG
jgi:protoporphyrinogen/coproporphyrinogen III oxidase